MYLRTIGRRNKDGSEVRYVQLAHNEWDSVRKCSVARVVHSFGREDQLDRAALARLVRSLLRALEPEQALIATAPADLAFVRSVPLGGAWALDGLWRRLGIDGAIERLLGERRLDARAERLLFAMVANRALAPQSKLSCCEWLAGDVAIPGLAIDAVGEDPQPLYRAMDWLLQIEARLAEQVYWATADLLNLEVDLLFFDTTSTYFERDEPDAAAVDEDGVAHPPFGVYGHFKDHREDLPQVVVGLAVTRTGIPIRAWCWPGNSGDQPLIRQVKDELREWKLSRVVWVADRGFQSAENRRYLQRAGGHYIIGEKLRGDSKEAKAALARQGRYHTVAGNLQVKEVVLDDGTMRDRFVICRNPEQAERDRHVRDELVKQLEQAIDGSDRLVAEERARLAGRLQAKRVLKRYLRQTKTGLLRVDRAAIAAEAHLDGKFLLRSSDPTLSAEDIALGYNQLLQVERAWRDMKTTLDLRPVHHRKEDRIRAHVQLCWLALLLIRIAEHETGDTWRNLRRELQRLHQGTFRGNAGEVIKTSQPTHKQQKILTTLGVGAPPAFPALAPAA
ncbi:MAG: IS1634 family transposase [Actinobacteria bacterium]|nr:IS1634 family transposase [Actinomycetota bacterium]